MIMLEDELDGAIAESTQAVVEEHRAIGHDRNLPGDWRLPGGVGLVGVIAAASSRYVRCATPSSASRTTRSSVSASNGFVSSTSSGDIVARAESDA